MKPFLCNTCFRVGLPWAVLLLSLGAGTLSTAMAEEIPPGFHRMPNGDIMANNPSKAVAPAGYTLTEGGILIKDSERSNNLNADNSNTGNSGTDNSSMDNLAAGNSEANSSNNSSNNSSSNGTSSSEGLDAFAAVAGVTVEEFGGVPAGYHRMSDGTLMANNPSKAVAPSGYHLMPDGTLMKDGKASDHSRHAHAAGGGMLMAEYKFQTMYMDGFLDTTTSVDHKQASDPTGIYGYAMSSTDMSMDMHMVMLMYHTRSYMLMMMGHYMVNSMGMYVSDGINEEYTSMKTQGLADTVLTMQVPWAGFDWTVGLSLPTGSIDERGDMVHAPGSAPVDTKYPYGMQLGSGTYDAIFGLGYESALGALKWGVRYEYTMRTGENDIGYTLGDKSVLDAWAKYNLSSTLTQSVRLKFLEKGQIEGFDPELVQTMSPAADWENYGGQSLGLGLAFRYENAQMSSFGIEFDLPVYQNLYGPQMKTDWMIGLNAGYMF